MTRAEQLIRLIVEEYGASRVQRVIKQVEKEAANQVLRKLLVFLAISCTCTTFGANECSADDTLAITLIAEASYSHKDHAAILHVLQRRADRAGVSIEDMARAYSAVWRKRNIPDRVFDAIEKYPHRYNLLMQRIDEFRAGALRNPCPGADHWGDAFTDRNRALSQGWRRLKCGTSNLFWSVR